MLLNKFKNSDLAWQLLPWGILVGFGSTMFAVIEFSGGFKSFLGIVETIITIIVAFFGIYESIQKIQANRDKNDTRRPRKKKSRS